MKQQKVMISIFKQVFALVVCSAFVFSCKSDDNKVIPSTQKISIKIGQGGNEIKVGETTSWDFYIPTRNGAAYPEVIWTSRDTTIAKVNKGTITGIKVGETFIIVSTLRGDKDSAKIKVVANTPPNTSQSAEAKITTFKFATADNTGFGADSVGKIDETNHKIAINVPFGANLKTLKPTITTSDKAKVSPQSGSVVDFSSKAATFEVTAENGTKVSYTVNVTVTYEDIPTSDIAFQFEDDRSPNHKYYVINKPKTWVDAAAYAKKYGGYLVEINSLVEQHLIESRLRTSTLLSSYTITVNDGGGSTYLWIGANDKAHEGTWIWDGDNDGSSTPLGNGTGTAGNVNTSTWRTASGAYQNFGKQPPMSGGQSIQTKRLTNPITSRMQFWAHQTDKMRQP